MANFKGLCLSNPASFLNTFVLAFLFIFLACSRTFLIKFSIRDGGYDYLPVTVNVMAELCKFIVCFVMFVYTIISKEEWNFVEAFQPSDIKWLEFFKWSIPGLLYFLDNLLGFYILVRLPPAVYSLLGNFVIITTAVLFRIVLRKKLSYIQWAALVILFLSIMALSSTNQSNTNLHHHHQVIRYHPLQTKGTNQITAPNICRKRLAEPLNLTQLNPQGPGWGQVNQGHILVLLQCVLSSTANIYNEKIFKEGNGMRESIYLQNSKLYMFGIIFNFLTLVLKADFREHMLRCGFFSGYNVQSTLLIFTTAFFGLTVALILKFRDNMFQIMSFQCSNVLVITSSVLFLDFHPTLEFFLIAPIVLLAIFIYNAGKKKDDKWSSQEIGGNYVSVPNAESNDLE